MYRIVPSSMSFSGVHFLDNLQPIVLETDESVLSAVVAVESGLSSLARIPISYTPAGGRVSIDLKDILHPYFSFSLVAKGERFVLQSRMLLFVSVTFMQDSSNSLIMSVIRGGVSGITGTVEEWCCANPLSWQSRRKYVLGRQPEFLTLYLKKDDGVSFSVYARKGTGATRLVIGQSVQVPQAGIYTFDVSPSAMSKIVDFEEGEHMAYYDVESSGGAKVQYVLDLPRSEDERWFLWENSLGGLDTVRFFGSESQVLTSEDKTINQGDLLTTYDVDSPRTWRQSTGTLSLRERSWLLDFFRSPNRYVFRGGVLYPIVLTEAGGEGATSDNVCDFVFTYRLSDDKHTLSASTLEENLPSLVIPSVSPADFQLPPHPSNLSPLSPGEGVLFPAILNNAWGIIGYNQLLGSLHDGLKPFVDKLIKDYVSWYLAEEGHQSSAQSSILISLLSQFKTLRLQAEELKRNKYLVDIVKVALTEAEQSAEESIDNLRSYFVDHHVVDDNQDEVMACEDALAYLGKVIFIANKSLSDKLTDQMLQQLHLSSQKNNVIALGYATDAQQAAFEHTNLIAESIDVSITNTQSLALILRSSEGNVLNTTATTDLSVVFRFNGHDITNKVKALTPAVTIIWERISKNNNHEGMTDEEWGNYALGRYVVTVKRAKKEQLSFCVSISDEDERRIIENFKPNRRKK